MSWSKKIDYVKGLCGSCLSFWGPLPSYEPIIPLTHYIQYVYTVYLFTQGRGVGGRYTREKVTKLGRKYQHDWLYSSSSSRVAVATSVNGEVLRIQKTKTKVYLKLHCIFLNTQYTKLFLKTVSKTVLYWKVKMKLGVEWNLSCVLATCQCFYCPRLLGTSLWNIIRILGNDRSID